VRKRDPRRLLARRGRERAGVRILKAQSGHAADGSIASRQTAEVTLPCSELDRIWTPEYLERLARTYWRFLTRVSLGLLRVLYTESSREIVLVARPLVLLRFSAPEYEIEPDRGSVTWRIDRGLLVAPPGRGHGYLRITVERGEQRGDEVTVTVSSEVASFYPTIAGWGWFARIGKVIYGFTQLRIHVIVTHAFLRSLARLDLEPSIVGALAPPEQQPTAPDAVPRS
jgi:hypothetical protein